ncbi:MAG: D-alanyl-lipoteichoic acid biosynthesis protein DltB [Atopobiaceae bacterium]|nr:D-alanyl-lipoteichoic acid biosynthesis protein DltB [Atopobiaceae bacterium]
MDFFVEPAFFVLCIPIVAVAFVLGMLERPLWRYAMGASAVMLFLLFFRSPMALVYAVAYMGFSVLLYRLALSGARNARNSEQGGGLSTYVLVALQILPLVAYKVGVLFTPDFPGFLGISYITFKSVQVLLEVHDGLIDDMSVAEYLGFLCFFPTFTSGPIMRSRPFVDDARTSLTRDGYLERFYRGAGWFVLGALYKFVGAALAQWAMWFVPAAVGNGAPGWLAGVFGYGMYLFFDFAGYSNMAMGLGLMLGVEVPRNFRAPFVAIDIKDFWDRWHISLSTWLRDFVFMRFSAFALGRKLFKSRVTCACVGFMLNMVLMGAWHGLTPAYLVYGLYHGVLLAVCHLMQKKWKFYKKHKRDRWFRIVSWAVTMMAVFFGFALFGGYVI